MKGKSLLTIILLSFVVVSLGYLVYGNIARNPGNDNGDILVEKESQYYSTNSRQIVAYYFHATKRCPTCLEIEALAKETIATNFAQELESGQLRWEIINYEDYGNEHYVDDYELMYSSLIISEQKNGEEISWKNLEKVWDYVWEKGDFIQYLKSEIESSLSDISEDLDTTASIQLGQYQRQI